MWMTVRLWNNPDVPVNVDALRLGFATAALREKPRRGDIFVVGKTKMDSSYVRSGICRPDGAGDLFGAGFYKDSAPDGVVAH